jgi:hypothetical protein
VMSVFGGIIMTTQKLCSKLSAFVLSISMFVLYVAQAQEVESAAAAVATWVTRAEQLSKSVNGASCATRLSDEIENFIKSKCSITESLYIRKHVRQPLSRFLLACCDAGLLFGFPVSLAYYGYTPAAVAEKTAAWETWLKGFRGDMEVAMSKDGIILRTAPATPTPSAVKAAELFIKTVQQNMLKNIVIDGRPELSCLKTALVARLSEADIKALDEFCKKPAFFKLKSGWRELANRLLAVCHSDIRV